MFDEIILSSSAMDQVESFDPVSGILTCQVCTTCNAAVDYVGDISLLGWLCAGKSRQLRRESWIHDAFRFGRERNLSNWWKRFNQCGWIEVIALWFLARDRHRSGSSFGGWHGTRSPDKKIHFDIIKNI